MVILFSILNFALTQTLAHRRAYIQPKGCLHVHFVVSAAFVSRSQCKFNQNFDVNMSVPCDVGDVIRTHCSASDHSQCFNVNARKPIKPVVRSRGCLEASVFCLVFTGKQCKTFLFTLTYNYFSTFIIYLEGYLIQIYKGDYNSIQSNQ